MTPYRKLMELFGVAVVETPQAGGAPVRYMKGGQARLAAALGVTQGLVSHWEKRHDGQIPAKNYGRICEAAASLGIPRRKVDELFEGCDCPTCGKPVVMTTRHI